MSENTIVNNINSLKEMILDEEKLVTYLSLSRELCLHVNESKLLLSKTVEEIKTKNPDVILNVSYIICGETENNNARTSVGTEDDINDLKKTLSKIFYEHIYSVRKGFMPVDNITFLASSKFEDLPLCPGLIKSNTCVKRTSDEIGYLKSNAQVPLLAPSEQIRNASKTKVKEESKVSSEEQEAKPVTKINQTLSEPTIKIETLSPKKNIANITNQKSDNKINGKVQKGIAGFFNRCNSIPGNKNAKSFSEQNEKMDLKQEKEVANKQKHAKKGEVLIDKKITIHKTVENLDREAEKGQQENKLEKMDVEESIPIPDKVKKHDIISTNGKDKPKTKSLNRVKKNGQTDKKRKRVIVADSESDDDPFADETENEKVLNHESEDEIPPTPSVATIKITSGIVNPRKRRKMVDKTYTDEEGYILTKKVEVYESCSDNEEDRPAKEPIAHLQVPKPVKEESSPKKVNGSKNSKKKQSPPQKGKQPTMMSFFKKM